MSFNDSIPLLILKKFGGKGPPTGEGQGISIGGAFAIELLYSSELGTLSDLGYTELLHAAELGQYTPDLGTEVHFVSETFDMGTSELGTL